MKNLLCGLMAVALLVVGIITMVPGTAEADVHPSMLSEIARDKFDPQANCLEGDFAIAEAADIVNGAAIAERDAVMNRFTFLLRQVERHDPYCTPAEGYADLANLAWAIAYAAAGQPYAHLADYGDAGCGDNAACREAFGLE